MTINIRNKRNCFRHFFFEDVSFLWLSHDGGNLLIFLAFFAYCLILSISKINVLLKYVDVVIIFVFIQVVFIVLWKVHFVVLWLRNSIKTIKFWMTKTQRKLKNINSKKYILLNDFKPVIGKDKITAHHKSFFKNPQTFVFENGVWLQESVLPGRKIINTISFSFIFILEGFFILE